MIYLPKFVKSILRPIYRASKSILYVIQDYYDLLAGHKNPLVPPRSMIFIGDGDYEKTGIEFLEYFKELGNLKPNDKILDVGCGIGRMSVPLTKYLSQEGAYYGFDIVKKGIDWCKENITSKYPNFHYEHADIYNKMYNDNGKEIGSKFKFKYEDAYFDFVFLTSVFTHMHTPEVNNYLKEISRVMKTGGRCLITFFVLNDESIKLIKDGSSTQNLDLSIDNYSFTKDKMIPENAIGFDETYIKEIFKSTGLKIDEPIYYGSWCGRKNYKSYQDIVIAQKL